MNSLLLLEKLIAFTKKSRKDYKYWQTQDKKTLKRIDHLIDELERKDVWNIIGKFKVLKQADGKSSLRIDQKNRMLFDFYTCRCRNIKYVIILRLKGHYDDK